ncbi:MAG: hypothetical protein V7L11_00065, partial [Nostoc sp.]|uniref:hypothetical protein n=1 Tax=Nostoc sp. TaxID=1180 RepID=UPI002FF8AE09
RKLAGTPILTDHSRTTVVDIPVSTVKTRKEKISVLSEFFTSIALIFKWQKYYLIFLFVVSAISEHWFFSKSPLSKSWQNINVKFEFTDK